MSRHANPTVIGAFVVGAVALAFFGAAALGAGRLFSRSQPFVLHFDDSVNGLRVGAPVKFKGVEIGSVKRIRLPPESPKASPPILVYIALGGSQLESAGVMETLGDPERLRSTIAGGLRARLESESFVTGVLYVSLEVDPDNEPKMHDPIEGYPEIPTVPGAIDLARTAAQSVLTRVEALDFNGLFDEAMRAARAIANLAESEELRSGVSALGPTLDNVSEAAKTLNAEIEPLLKSVRAATDEAPAVERELQQTLAATRETLGSVRTFVDGLDQRIAPLLDMLKVTAERLQQLQVELQAAAVSARALLDPHSPIATELARTLTEVSAAARSTRSLLEALERNPDMFLRGKTVPETDRR